MRLRVGVDAVCLANGRGYGRFARELLTSLVATAPADFVLFADERAEASARATGADVRVVPQRVSPSVAAAADRNRAPADLLRFTHAVWRERLDVFFSPSVYSYFPLPPRLPALVCVHDAIADRFPLLTLPSRRDRLFWRAKTRLALFQARLILTVSEYAARDIAACYRIPLSRIRIAVEAPSAEYFPSTDTELIQQLARRAGVPEGASWFIYVGGFNPHKHVDVIVRAHAEVARALVAQGSEPAPHLLLVGTLSDDVFHGDVVRIRAAIAAAGTEHLVHWTDFVVDAELRHLLSGAVALLLPSEAEGFGLPAVEAAACGTPVIATRESPLPDLLGEGGFFVAPRDEPALVTAMRALADDPLLREAKGRAAKSAASRLSWKQAAKATFSAICEVAA